jgi:hypothetical protein
MSGVGELREVKIMDKLSVMTMPVKDARPESRAPLPLTAFKPTYDAIAKRAYEIAEDAGFPQGRDVEFWLMAERELITER